MFSVVVIAAGCARSLTRTMRSIAAQVYPAAEVIVIDRSANGGAALREVGEIVTCANVRPLSRPNSPIGAARNLALRQLAHDFALFLDEGDELVPLALEHFHSQFQRHPQAGMAYGRVIARESDGRLTPSEDQSLPSGYILDAITRGDLTLEGSSVAFRRQLLAEGHRFSDRVPSDISSRELVLRAAMRTALACAQEDVVIRSRPTPAATLEGMSAWCRVLADSGEELAQHLGHDFVRQSRAMAEWRAAGAWWSAQERAQAIAHYEQCTDLAPEWFAARLLTGILRAAYRFDRRRRPDQRPAA